MKPNIFMISLFFIIFTACEPQGDHKTSSQKDPSGAVPTVHEPIRKEISPDSEKKVDQTQGNTAEKEARLRKELVRAETCAALAKKQAEIFDKKIELNRRRTDLKIKTLEILPKKSPALDAEISLIDAEMARLSSELALLKEQSNNLGCKR